MPAGVKQSSYGNQPAGVFEIEGFWEVLCAWHRYEEMLIVPEKFNRCSFFPLYVLFIVLQKEPIFPPKS